ncbi:hypothetical protein D3C80_1842820 [compost metagenome]
MQRQILRMTRRAMCRQIGRCSADHRGAGRERSGDQIGIQLIGNSQRQIDTLFDQIHCAVIHLQIHSHLRMTLKVLCYRAHQRRLTQRLRAGDP